MEKKKSAVVRKSNIFIDGRYRFGLHEQKILLLVVSHIGTSEKDFTSYKIPWAEIKRVSSGRLNTVAKIDKACENLKSKTISITHGHTTDNFGFLSGWKTHQGKFVEFRIDPSMKKMLLGLLDEGNFTLYDLEFALALPSTHAVRMYEILKSHFWKKQPVVIPLNDLKKSLDIPLNSPTYSNFSNFRTFIIDRVKKNLTRHTDITFTYHTIKECRKVVSISFTIKDNKKYQRTIQAVTGRNFIRSGDVILIGGEKVQVDGSACYYQKQCFPIGQLTEMLQKGQIKLLEGEKDG